MHTISFENSNYSVEEAFNHALALLGKGMFREVADICKLIVAVDPNHYRALHGIGIGLYRSGNHKEAIESIQKSLTLKPDYFEAYNNLGNILKDSGRIEEALNIFKKGRDLRPDDHGIHFNIARTFKAMGRVDQAIESFQKAIDIESRIPDYYFSLAVCYQDHGDISKALTAYSKALELKSDFLAARYGLATCLHNQGSTPSAEAEYKRILEVNSSHVDALYGLATLRLSIDDKDGGYQLLKKVVSLQPTHVNALVTLGNLLYEQCKLGREWAQDEAIQFYQQALLLSNADCTSHNTLGNLYLSRGEIDKALSEYREAVAIEPQNPIARSCLLMCLQYQTAPALAELHLESDLWAEKCASHVSRTSSYGNNRNGNRLLKVGFVSGDLKMHPVGFYLLPYLYHHNSSQVEIHCFSNSDESDHYTERIQSYTDYWHEISGLTDQQACELIRSINIDILIDLSGHTGGNRLLLFAAKPAPVQISWLGYYFTTGLKEIDYIFMDESAVTLDEDMYFSEKVIRLPQSRFCYEPPRNAPDIAQPPALKNKYITFGSFNNLAKMTPTVIRAWAAILKNVSGSKLLLKAHSMGNEAVRDRIIHQYALEGVSRDQLILRGVSPHKEMLAEYGDIDIALDPFPFNGGLTSCEALWMGVPVVTFYGNRPIARQTSGFLKTVGLEGFIAPNETEYIKLALKWSTSLHELIEIRNSLRSKMNNSLLCDGKRFSAGVEATLRQLWQNWCNKSSDYN